MNIFIILFFLFSSIAHADTWTVPLVGDTPQSFQTRADYLARVDGLPTYLGNAPKGIATSTSSWIIFKYTYDGNSQMTLKQTAVNVKWDDRLTETYN